MSHIVTDVIACPKIQRDLDSNFVSCDPTLIRESIGFLEFLRSSTNTSGIMQSQISPGNGKRRQVELVYTPRVNEVEIGTVPVKNCVSTNEAGQLSQIYSIQTNQGVVYDEKFDVISFSEMCMSNAMWFAMRLQAMMDGLIRRMDTELVAQAASLTGNFAVGDNDVAAQVKTVQTKFTDGKPDTNLLEEVRFSSTSMGYCSIPYLFGFNELDKYFNRIDKGCCADSGLDIGEFSRNKQMVYIQDYRIANTFGTDNFIATAAGAMQLIWWNEFMGDRVVNVVDDEAYKQTILRDPATGIPFDFILKNDCGVISVQLKLAFRLIGMPVDMYSDGDRLDGVVQVNEYIITNP